MAETGRDLSAELFGGGDGDRSSVDTWRQTLRLDDLEQQYRLPSGLMTSVLRQESGGDPRVRSSAGAQGLFQFMPATAKSYGIDPLDPQQAAPAAAKELSTLYKKYHGDVDRTLAAWNWGQGNVDRKGLANMPTETRGFLTHVKRFLSPGVAEAATPAPGQGRDLSQELFGTAAGTGGRDLTQELMPPEAPAPPTARSTPEQAAAYRQWAAQQAPGGTQTPAPVSQTPPPSQAQPGASQGLDTRFLALPSIQHLPPAERQQRLAEFRGLRPDLQAEFLASEEPPSQMTIDIEKPSTPQAAAVPTATMREGIQALEPLDPDAASRMLAARSPLPSVGAQARTLGGIAVPALTGIGGAMLGGTLGGPAGAVAGGAAGGVYGTRLATQLGLTEQEQPLLDTVVGPVYPSDVLNVGVPVVAGAAAPVVAKVGNALRGVVKPAYQKVMDLADRYGIRLSYGDVSRGSVAPKVEAALEAIPGSGAGRFRVQQQQQVAQAGEEIRGGLQAEMGTTPWRDLPAVQRAAGGTGPRAKEAQALLAEIDNAGDDWGRVIQTSGKLNLFQDRLRAEKLYDQVETLAQPLGNMRLPKTTAAIDDALARATDDVLPSPEVRREVIGALNRIRGEVSPTESVRPSMGVRDPVTGTLRAEPVTPTTTVPDTTYSRMRRLHSALGDLQRDAAEPTTARYLSGVKTALNDDMAAFAQQSTVPELRTAHKAADTFYRTRIVPYREGQLAKAIEKDLPDEIYGKFVRQGKDRAEYFYKGLDPRGQAAVRYGMVQEAFEKATSGPHPDVFSPARFSGALRKIQEATGVFFKGQPQWEINGVTKLMQHAQRAGQFMENPPTGLRGSIGTALVGGGLWSPAAVGGSLLSANGLRTMLMTRPGRNFLLAASDLQPGSAAFQRALDRFLRTAPAATAGVGAGLRAVEEETVPPAQAR